MLIVATSSLLFPEQQLSERSSSFSAHELCGRLHRRGCGGGLTSHGTGFNHLRRQKGGAVECEMMKLHRFGRFPFAVIDNSFAAFSRAARRARSPSASSISRRCVANASYSASACACASALLMAP